MQVHRYVHDRYITNLIESFYGINIQKNHIILIYNYYVWKEKMQRKALIMKTDSNHTWGAGEMAEWLRVSICDAVKKKSPKALLKGMALLK